MTLDEFLDKVPWHRFTVSQHGGILRTEDKSCLISAVTGDPSDYGDFLSAGRRLGLTEREIDDVLMVGDNFCDTPERQALRAEMLRRLEAAQ